MCVIHYKNKLKPSTVFLQVLENIMDKKDKFQVVLKGYTQTLSVQ
jgi:hypothetical protein